MQVNVCSRGFTLTPALQQAVEAEAVGLAEQFPGGVGGVTVRLYDINGPRGGPDKGCLVQARLGRARLAVVARDVGSDLYRVIGRAFAKLAQSARASLRRQQSRRRERSSPGARPVDLLN